MDWRSAEIERNGCSKMALCRFKRQSESFQEVFNADEKRDQDPVCGYEQQGMEETLLLVHNPGILKQRIVDNVL